MATSELTRPCADGIDASSWRDYYELTKPKVVLLISFTALVGMLLSTDGSIHWPSLLFGLIGIAMAAASGAAINHIVDQKIDAKMQRTKNRPFPSGQMDTPHASLLAALLGLGSMLILTTLVNPLTALLSLMALIGYAGVYTLYLKRSTPQNIVWGGIAGAVPPMLGWAAMTNEVSQEALVLTLIIFIWTPPHFWPLAIHRRDDYAKVNVPMLPVTHGIEFTKQQILIYSAMLFAVSLMPFLVHMSGLIYLFSAVVLGLGFVYHAWKLWRSEDNRHAMKTFGYSIFYLSALFAALLIDHYIKF